MINHQQNNKTYFCATDVRVSVEFMQIFFVVIHTVLLDLYICAQQIKENTDNPDIHNTRTSILD